MNQEMMNLFFRMMEEYIDERVGAKVKEILHSEDFKKNKLETAYRYCDRSKLAEILKVSEQTITNRTSKGKYTPKREGRANVYDLDEIKELHPELVNNYYSTLVLSKV